jgi:CPA2 family monovalent cation:H+ antiporter-2
MVKVYAKAQIALRQTLSEAPAAEHAAELSPILRDAMLETVLITDRSPAKGRLIRELALRTRTGASVVAIERDGVSIVNPGPDEELQPGDRVLLLGTRQHLDAARQLLVSNESSA